MRAPTRGAAVATAAALIAAACAERDAPFGPVPTGAAVEAAAVTEAPPAASVVGDAAAMAAVALDDALDRVIPGLGTGRDIDVLHDAVDRVADALEDRDPQLARRVRAADESLAQVAASAPPHVAAELDALRLALDAVRALEVRTAER